MSSPLDAFMFKDAFNRFGKQAFVPPGGRLLSPWNRGRRDVFSFVQGLLFNALGVILLLLVCRGCVTISFQCGSSPEKGILHS